MSTRNETLRRVMYALAMLTGVALVGSQFGCSRPRTFLLAAGFPHAGRWVETPDQARHAQSEAVTDSKTPQYWTSPRATLTQSSPAESLNGLTDRRLRLKPLKVSPLAATTPEPPLVIVLPQHGE